MLDQVDLAIIQRLESNARLSMDELAQQVRVGAAECAARVRRLERTGHIVAYEIVRGYPEPTSRPTSGVFQVRLDPARDGSDFWRSLDSIPEIVTAEAVRDDGSVLLRALTSTEDRLHEIARTLRKQSIVLSVGASASVIVVARRFSPIE